jgi:hypothetical protein
VVEHLLSKYEARNSNPVLPKKKRHKHIILALGRLRLGLWRVSEVCSCPDSKAWLIFSHWCWHFLDKILNKQNCVCLTKPVSAGGRITLQKFGAGVQIQLCPLLIAWP